MARIWNKLKQTNTPLKKIFVGLSGGVDSSVALALLQREGYEVTGVFIKTWQPSFVHCTAKEDRLFAMRVCATLDVPFLTLDLEKEYKEGVVDYMISEYAKGRTPNPDVMCNREIKFGAFLNFALRNGADFIATGHYAERVYNQRTALYELHRGKDLKKDQSYFLHVLGQKELSHTLFPLGGLEKKEVRALAKSFNLPTADKKDSQGICFLGEVDMKDFLARFIKTKRGDVLDLRGEKIGSHDGALLYTLGERHGFKVESSGHRQNPLYVIAKDVVANTLTVSEEIVATAGKRRFALEKTYCVNPKGFPSSVLDAQVRYHGDKYPCRIETKKGVVSVAFSAPIMVSSGQSIVFYSNSECLGGGVVAD